ncbi:6073_t:CDS:1, partial [Ambispora gerdemannii]
LIDVLSRRLMDTLRGGCTTMKMTNSNFAIRSLPSKDALSRCTITHEGRETDALSRITFKFFWLYFILGRLKMTNSNFAIRSLPSKDALSRCTITREGKETDTLPRITF